MMCISDWKESPEDTLKQVDEAIREYGLKVEIGNSNDDQIYWAITKSSTDES